MTALLQGYEDQDKAIILEDINFITSKGFNISAFIILVLLIYYLYNLVVIAIRK